MLATVAIYSRLTWISINLPIKLFTINPVFKFCDVNPDSMSLASLVLVKSGIGAGLFSCIFMNFPSLIVQEPCSVKLVGWLSFLPNWKYLLLVI